MTEKILHLRASNFVGGPERQLMRYAENRSTANTVIGVFAAESEGKGFLEALNARGLPSLALSSSSREAMRELKRFVAANSVRLICTHGYKADVLGCLCSHSTGVPVAFFLRGWTGEDWKVRLYEAADRFFLRFADRVVCLSQTQAAEMPASLRPKIRVVTNAIAAPSGDPSTREQSRQQLVSRFRLSGAEMIVAAAGRLSPEKGGDLYIEAAASIAKNFPSVRFLLFGDGPLRKEFEARILQLGASSICLTGHVPDFPDLLPGIDLFVSPSRAEQMPNVLLEAMACGVPSIATDVGAVAEIAHGDASVALISSGSIEALAAAMTTALQDPAALRRAGSGAPAVIKTYYSPERQQKQLNALYDEFLSPSLHRALVPAGALPLISVVLPVRNEERHIGKVLNALEAQEYPSDRVEILVADGASTDNTCAIVSEFASRSRFSIRLYDNPGLRSSAGRNVGIRSSHGDIVMFVDGHCYIGSTRMLADTAQLMSDTGADCLCRPQPLHDDHNTPFQDLVARVRATPLGHGRDSLIYDLEREGPAEPMSSGAIYRKDVFARIGIYDEQFDACEDVELNYRVHAAGLRSYTSPRLAVYYVPRATLRGLWKQMMRYGRGRVRLMRKHHDAITLAQLIPAGLVLLFTVGVISAAAIPPSRWPIGAAIAIYGLAVLVSSAPFGRKAASAALIYLAIHFGLGAGFWTELLSLRKPATPEMTRSNVRVSGTGEV